MKKIYLVKHEGEGSQCSMSLVTCCLKMQSHTDGRPINAVFCVFSSKHFSEKLVEVFSKLCSPTTFFLADKSSSLPKTSGCVKN